jgi:hypothetical protein
MKSGIARSVLVFAVVGVSFLLPFVRRSEGQLAKGNYELQERCGKRAEEYVGRHWGTGRRDTIVGYSRASYEARYNARSNICLVLVTEFLMKSTNEMISESRFLIDPNSNQLFGYYFRPKEKPKPTICYILLEKQRNCEAESEWYETIGDYMNDVR